MHSILADARVTGDGSVQTLLADRRPALAHAVMACLICWKDWGGRFAC
jgi:hypothetical protein